MSDITFSPHASTDGRAGATERPIAGYWALSAGWEWRPGGEQSAGGAPVQTGIALLILICFLLLPALQNLFFIGQSTLG